MPSLTQLAKINTELLERTKKAEADAALWRKMLTESIAAYNQLYEDYAILAYKEAGY